VSMAASEQPQGRGADPNGYNEVMFEQLAWRPTESAAFGGGLPYRRYGWFVRQIMKRISKAAGHTTDTTHDHVFTDSAAVAAFANQLAATIAKPDPAPDRGRVQPRLAGGARVALGGRR